MSSQSLFWLVPAGILVVLALPPALLDRSFKRFFVGLVLSFLIVVLPLFVFGMSFFMVPEWKGAAKAGWVSCFLAGKTALTPLVLWAVAALYAVEVLRVVKRTVRWIVHGLIAGALVSTVCSLYGVGMLVGAVVEGSLGHAMFLWLLVPFYVAVWYSIRLGRVVREAPLAARDYLFAGVSSVPFWIGSVVWSNKVYASLPDQPPSFRPFPPLLEFEQCENPFRDRLWRLMIDALGDLGFHAAAAHAQLRYRTICDELGLLVWQDMMLANFDYPQTDETFRAAVDAEAETLLLRTQTAPSLAVLCGGSEVFQQAAMLGAPPENWSGPIFDEVLPAAAKRLRPDIAYVPNSPSGGPLPFVANSGVTHYYGVGAYMRDLDDARRARVRFASECLAFANVPDEISLSAAGVPAIAHHPAWKQGVPRDFGASWDFEDVRDHYLERLYGASAMHLRRENPERYFALSRAVVAEVMEATYAEWRRPDSPTRGALVWMLQDLQPGAGWGVIASDGAPKSAWHALARAFRPVQIALTDEGVNGLAIHLTNERPFDIDARIELTCWRDGATPVARASWDQKLAARSAVSVSTFERIGSFFDISYAYRFGPPSHDATSVALVDATTGDKLAEAFHFPLGRGNAQRETKLAAQLEQNGDRWSLGISAARFAQSVHIVDEDWLPSDNWFHLTPGVVKWITLEPRGPKSRAPQGEVRAVNAIERAQYGA